MICTHRINPACGIPRFLSRFARRAGLVHLRQTFVLRCHGDDGGPLRAEASSNHALLYAMALGRAPPPPANKSRRMPLRDSQRGVDAPWLFEARPRFVSHRRALRAALAFPATSLTRRPSPACEPALGPRSPALAVRSTIRFAGSVSRSPAAE